ncbi:hypothetical protein NLY44_21530 [Mesorhizobium sp. C089B]|nr:hypothetical protein [Mesorhizobium sp. C089B]WJI49216.1 hypothetical protein NLY44_21530 [Mesorhizobium sp. C089B]
MVFLVEPNAAKHVDLEPPDEIGPDAKVRRERLQDACNLVIELIAFAGFRRQPPQPFQRDARWLTWGIGMQVAFPNGIGRLASQKLREFGWIKIIAEEP